MLEDLRAMAGKGVWRRIAKAKPRNSAGHSIVMSAGSMYIEDPLARIRFWRTFKLLHRAVDVKKAQTAALR